MRLRTRWTIRCRIPMCLRVALKIRAKTLGILLVLYLSLPLCESLLLSPIRSVLRSLILTMFFAESMAHLPPWTLILISSALLCLYLFASMIYRLYFSPLAKVCIPCSFEPERI